MEEKTTIKISDLFVKFSTRNHKRGKTMNEPNFNVDQEKYKYLEPLWSVLENNPDGIKLDDALKQAKLSKKPTLKLIGDLSREYNNVIARVTNQMFSKGNVMNIVNSMISGERKDKELAAEYENKLVRSWIFDKFLLYCRIKELDFSDMVSDKEAFERLKGKWLASKGQ